MPLKQRDKKASKVTIDMKHIKTKDRSMENQTQYYALQTQVSPKF